MKKIILILLIILINLSFSKNLSENESKRVFQKSLDYILNGNYEKYKDDREIENLENYQKLRLDIIRPFFKDNKYEVVDIAESDYYITLVVKARVKKYKNISTKEKKKLLKEYAQDLNERKNERLYMQKTQELLNKEFKDKEIIEEEVIGVYINKRDNFYNIDLNNNIELTETLSRGFYTLDLWSM